MATKTEKIDFSRRTVKIEIRFVNGMECCEWCNMSYRNLKRHIACKLTDEEMACPSDSIGWRCPIRKLEEQYE